MKKISLTSNKLKTIAITAMIFDHFIGGFVPINGFWSLLLRMPGRIAAPIMCYLIAEGYYHTKNLNKYIFRLFVFSLISHLPYNLYFGLELFQATSVMWSLCLGLIALSVYKKENINIYLRILAVFICCILSVRANWNYLAVLWILFFGIFKGNIKKQTAALLFIGLLQIVPVYLGVGPVIESCPHFYRFGIYLSIPLIYLYNGEKGKGSKFISKIFYFIYPVHLMILYLLKLTVY